MTMRLVGRFLKVALIAGLANGAAAQVTPAISGTVWDGVYTNAQALRGRTQYRSNCSRCHQLDLTGNSTAPMLKAETFMERWREDNVNSLWTYMRIRMPPPSTDPRLDNSTYLDITAYILKENGFPEGTAEMAPDTLRDIRIVRREGPQPLPTNAVALVVGCLTEANGWTLTRATEPVRTRMIAELRPLELEASAAKKLGTATVQLHNLEYLDSFDPAAFRGYKMQARGAFTQDASGGRLNVVAMEMVAQTCQ